MNGKVKRVPLRVSEADAAADEVQSLLAEMVLKHGMSLGSVLAGARRAIGRVQSRQLAAGIDLAAVRPAGRA